VSTTDRAALNSLIDLYLSADSDSDSNLKNSIAVCNRSKVSYMHVNPNKSPLCVERRSLIDLKTFLHTSVLELVPLDNCKN
jgi:hypothetical protein